MLVGVRGSRTNERVAVADGWVAAWEGGLPPSNRPPRLTERVNSVDGEILILSIIKVQPSCRLVLLADLQLPVSSTCTCLVSPSSSKSRKRVLRKNKKKNIQNSFRKKPRSYLRIRTGSHHSRWILGETPSQLTETLLTRDRSAVSAFPRSIDEPVTQRDASRAGTFCGKSL